MTKGEMPTFRTDSSDQNIETEHLDENEMLQDIVCRIRAIKKEGTSIIVLIGGAGSGKTTLAQKISETLGSADTLGTDDFVVGDREYRRKHIEGNDPTQKYDPVFLNKKIRQIRSLKPGEDISVPTYDETSGLAIAVGEENYHHKIGKIDYLVVEGDFEFVENPDLVIYFDVPDEVRLKNRIKRDTQTRSETDPQKISDNFSLRHKLQHLPHTLPAKNKADLVIEVYATEIENGFNYSYSVKPGANTDEASSRQM